VQARLVARAEDWRWSSARAHLAGRDDGVVSAAPLLGEVGDWAGFLAGGLSDAAAAAIRAAERTGRADGLGGVCREPGSGDRAIAGEAQAGAKEASRTGEFGMVSPNLLFRLRLDSLFPASLVRPVGGRQHTFQRRSWRCDPRLGCSRTRPV